MLKLVEPSWNFGSQVVSHVKIASTGIKGIDYKNLAKETSEEFAHDVKNLIKPASGEEYVHVIALGSLEYYGCNRVGDAFEVEVCKKYHPTFTKKAKWYRNHIHHDPSRSYGVVKLSHFDPKLNRIDLIAALNATKTAADRNGGLIADKELEKLYSGETIPVSMACYVSYDICSGCGHKAKNVYERCTPNICVKYGGCKDNLGKTFDDGHTLHVKNPDPVFFDISYVTVPADRIAFSIGLVKDPNVSIKKLADVGLRNILYKTIDKPKHKYELVSKKVEPNSITLTIVAKMAALERHGILPEYNKYTSALASRPIVQLNEHVPTVISTLNKYACVAPPLVFFREIYPVIRKKNPVNAHIDVSTCFRDLLKSASRDIDLETNPYLHYTSGELNRTKVNWLKENWSLNLEKLNKDIAFLKKQANFRRIQEVRNPELAKEYALYQLGFLLENTRDDLKQVLVLANQIGDK